MAPDSLVALPSHMVQGLQHRLNSDRCYDMVVSRFRSSRARTGMRVLQIRIPITRAKALSSGTKVCYRFTACERACDRAPLLLFEMESASENRDGRNRCGSCSAFWLQPETG